MSIVSVRQVAGMVSLFLFLACGSLEHTNPNDDANNSFVTVEIAQDDGLVVGVEGSEITWEGLGELESFSYQLDDGKNISGDTTSSLLLDSLDEGDHVLVVQMVNQNGDIDNDTLHFTVDAVQGPSILLEPLKQKWSEGVLKIHLRLEEVLTVSGINTRLVYNSKVFRFAGFKASAGWQAFADEIHSDTLELSLSDFRDSTGFSGSARIMELHFDVLDSDLAPKEFRLLEADTRLSDANSRDITINEIRGAVVE